jgi:solute:Na+ symporter, SSS family
MNLIDLIVFCVYMLGITVFGISFYRKNKTAQTFTLGNSNFPSWVVSMSIFATYVSSISFLALPGSAYRSNWNAFVFSLSIPIAAYMAVKFFIPLYRKVNSPSAYAYMEMRFGPWARIYVSSCYLLTQIMRIGTILFLLALPLNILFGWSIAGTIVVTGLLVTVYSLLGGIQAVVWADAIQGIILIAGAVTCLLFVLFSAPGGPAEIFSIAVDHNKFSLGSFGASVSQSTFWVVFVYGIFINLQNYGIDQNYVQRYMASRSDRSAKRAAFFGGVLYIPVSLIFFMIGTALFSYYTLIPDALPVELKSIEFSDRVFPYFIVHKLPAGLTGLLIASIFAAGMSTISTSINSSATVILTDYYIRFRKKMTTDTESLRILYVSSFAVSTVGVAVGMLLINAKGILDTWWTLASVFSGGMLGLFLLGAFVPKVNSKVVLIAIIPGLLTIFWLSLSPILLTGVRIGAWASPFHSYLTIVLGTMVIFLTGFLVTATGKR